MKKEIAIVLFLMSGWTFANAQYPTTYDLRNLGQVTSVKDQGNCGACWAFATCAAIESAWLKQGFAPADLSEDHLIDCHGFDESPCQGGSFYMSQALLSRHLGPLTETSDPYSPALQNCTMGFPFPPLAPAHVEEVRFVPPLTDSIKSALMNVGAVATSMYFNSANYNAQNYQYLDPVIDASDLQFPHCVTIVGWNDNLIFSGANNPGGWIVKDSYGTSWAQNGYFFCSYEDAGILSENAVFPVRQALPAQGAIEHVYLYDEFGWVDNYGFGSNVGYALTKYTITPASGVVLPQIIKRIGTYAVHSNTLVEVAVFLTKTGNTLSDQIATSSVFCPQPGFYTMEFDLEPLNLLTDLYVRVKYTTPPGIQSPIPIEKLETGHTSGFNPATNSCWVSASGSSWTLTGQGTSNNFDACVKLYTENVDFTGISEVEPIQFTLFPIPVSEMLTVKLSDEITMVTGILLSDASGRIVHQVNDMHTNTIELDVSSYPSGVYRISLETSDGWQTRSWVKE